MSDSSIPSADSPAAVAATITTQSQQPQLSALGFCGADDSIHPHQLAILSAAYPQIEFGVLFRPDREGSPRYASPKWVSILGRTARTMMMQQQQQQKMKLAAHLCGSRVNDLLEGRGSEFLMYLLEMGFQRVQINATAVNGVDTSRLADCVPTLWNILQTFPQFEFILQKNDETQPLWSGIEALLLKQCNNPRPTTNIAMLLDESKGTGVLSSSWPTPSALSKTGYAGGIGPHNVTTVLQDILHVVQQQPMTTDHDGAHDDDININPSSHYFWIDMESSLRSIKNGNDIFDLDKCYQVIDAVCNLKLMKHPPYLCCSDSDDAPAMTSL